MKHYSGFVPTDRRAWHRAELLALLGGDDALLAQLEQAENDYLFRAGQAQACEADAIIRDELAALAEAVETLQSIYNPGGSAKAFFEGEAFPLVRGDRLQQLRDLFQGAAGEALAMAARAAADKFKVRNGRPPDYLVTERRALVEAVAAIAERTGITVSRGSLPFSELLGAVFDRVGAESDSASFVDEEIRHYIKGRKPRTI